MGNGTSLNHKNAFEVTTDGTIVVGGHDTPVGYTRSQTVVSQRVADETVVALGQITLTPGTWIIFAHVLFEKNTSGHREISLNTVSGNIGTADITKMGFSKTVPTSTGKTVLNSHEVASITDDTTYYLNVYQKSGSYLTVEGHLKAVRIA